MKLETLKVTKDGHALTVEINRLDVRNAFNDRMIDELQHTFESVNKEESVRMIILRGAGPTFCAGGDLNWMQRSVTLSPEENLRDTKKLTKMFATMNSCTKPVVGLVQGAAIGGGVGLVSICDYVVCVKDTVFSLSEVRLGIVPACIGPFVVAKIGESQARAYFVSAERFDAQRAREIGLVHELVADAAGLDAARERIVKNLSQCGPIAMATAKTLVREIKERSAKSPEDAYDYVSRTLANLRTGAEGQEGLKAFLEKRKPSWIGK